jgi:hypothetical protein
VRDLTVAPVLGVTTPELRYLTDFTAFMTTKRGSTLLEVGQTNFDLRETHRIGKGKFPISKLEIKA